MRHVGHPEPEHASRPEPTVPIEKSVCHNYIVCLKDGRKLKMLKRHLASTYNMTSAEYRTHWGLPADNPVVVPSYAERRSALAREIGLGKKANQPGPLKLAH